MQYRGGQDRTVSTFVALLIIVVVGIVSTLAIMHAISKVDFSVHAASTAEANS